SSSTPSWWRSGSDATRSWWVGRTSSQGPTAATAPGSARPPWTPGWSGPSWPAWRRVPGSRPASSGRVAVRVSTSRADRGRARLRLTHLGAAGWIISDGRTTVLLDPYLSRIRFSGRTFGAPEAATVPGDTRPLLTMDDVPPTDSATIDARLPRADFILLSH